MTRKTATRASMYLANTDSIAIAVTIRTTARQSVTAFVTVVGTVEKRFPRIAVAVGVLNGNHVRALTARGGGTRIGPSNFLIDFGNGAGVGGAIVGDFGKVGRVENAQR